MHGNEWTVANVDRLKELWAKGFSASLIGAELPFTRSAILGKIMRLKLPARAVGRSSPRKRAESERPHVSKLPGKIASVANFTDVAGGGRQRRVPSGNITEKAAIAQAEPGLPKYLEEPAVGKGLSLIELTKTTCRWPFGDPLAENFYFCGAAGADLEEKRPYCPFHARHI